MGKFLAGIVIGLVAFPIVVLAYFQFGKLPAGVTDNPFPLEKFISGVALHAIINREAPKRELSSFTKDDVVAGALAYRESDCQDCHGFPSGVPLHHPTHVLYPPAPLLFTADGNVTDDPVGVTYWKVKNGIRLSGMPSYSDRLSDQQMWQVAAFVENANSVPPEAIAALQAAPMRPPTGLLGAVPPRAPGKK